MDIKLEEVFYEFVKDNHLINENEHVLLAFSGGSDSCVLFDLLLKLQKNIDFSFSAFHLNHKIRKESYIDEEFVEEICKKNNITLHKERVDIIKLSKEKKEGLEVLSRNIRYTLMEEIKKEYGYNKILTGHHLDDHMESVFLNIIRGCGVSGLLGIDIKRKGGVFRPLMCFSKEDIEKYIKENNISYIQDKTNFSKDYTRNNIRLDIIPKMKEINPNLQEGIFKLSSISKEYTDFISKFYKDIKIHRKEGGVWVYYKDIIDLEDIVLKEFISYLFKEFMSVRDVSYKHIQDILNKLRNKEKTSFEIHTSNNLSFIRRYDKIYIQKKQDEKADFEYKVNKKGRFVFSRERFFVEFIEVDEICKESSKELFVDLDKIKRQLYIRNKRQGDKFYPLGLIGSKTLKKYFIDKKIVKEKRDKIPLLLEGEEIISILGYGVSEKYKIDKNTKNILKIIYKEF